MPWLELDIALPADRLQTVYRGQANRVLVTSRDGRRVSLPAHYLRPFVGQARVYGRFFLEFTAEGKLLSLRRRD
nr:DUF2835 domain-containing protein [Gammaproteobacteria bacterium]